MRTTYATLGLLFVACGGDRHAEPPPPPLDPAHESLEEQVTPETAPAPAPWEGAVATPSNAGRWDVRWTSEPSPIPENAPFALSVWVLNRNGEPARVELSVDAGMPDHGHGMNRVPQVTAVEGGGFLAEGLLFHMPGRWELYFDVTRGAMTERAQVEVVLE